MLIRARGRFEGRPVEVELRDDQLAGDAGVLERIEIMVEIGITVAIAGVWTGKAGLRDPQAARATLLQALEPPAEILELEGVPELELPDGVAA